MPIGASNRNAVNATQSVVTRAGVVKNVSFEQFVTRLSTIAANNQDYYVKGSDLDFRANGTLAINDGTRTPTVLSWNDWSFSQFCAKLKIPTDFLRKSPEGEGPASKKAIVDYWKERASDKDLLVRARKILKRDEESGAEGFVRAFLTKRYAILDNHELFATLRPLVKKHGLVTQVGQVADKTLHVRLVFPEFINVAKGATEDLHQIGIHLRNSEVGVCNLMGDFSLFRQVCTNGMIVQLDKQHLFNEKHVGIDRHQIRVAANSAFEVIEDRRDEVLGRIHMAQEIRLHNPLRELNRFLRGFREVKDSFIESAERTYEREPNPTRFGIIQAITKAAHALPADQRANVEEIAGRLLLAA